MEEISDRTPVVKDRTGLNRLIGLGGFEINHFGLNIKFVDSNDLVLDVRKSIDNISLNETLPNDNRHIDNIGKTINKKYKVYAFLDSQPIITFSFIEFLDSGYGYGSLDFYYTKYVYPDFRKTRICRIVTFSLLFAFGLTGISSRVYSFTKAREDETIKNKWVDFLEIESNPCIPELFDGDGEGFITVSKLIDTSKGKFAVFEFDFQSFNNRGVDALVTSLAAKHEVQENLIRTWWSKVVQFSNVMIK